MGVEPGGGAASSRDTPEDRESGVKRSGLAFPPALYSCSSISVGQVSTEGSLGNVTPATRAARGGGDGFQSKWGLRGTPLIPLGTVPGYLE